MYVEGLKASRPSGIWTRINGSINRSNNDFIDQSITTLLNKVSLEVFESMYHWKYLKACITKVFQSKYDLQYILKQMYH
jgi:hypothetical protein